MIKISVVIPVYNAQKTLEKCVNSLVTHSYQNLEIVLVNDGSKDDSLLVCQQLAERYSFINILNKANEGVARARNDGLNMCTGDYVYFVDPDDLVNDELFYIANKILSKEYFDVLVFGHEKSVLINNKELKKQIIPMPFIIKNGIGKNKNLTNMYLSGAGFSAWDKLINIHFLKNNNILFPLLKRGQDMAFCANVFKAAESICCLDKIYYYYLDFNTTNNNKIDPNIIENHKYIFNCFINLFNDGTILLSKNPFLTEIYLKWFFYVVPNNILNSDLTFDNKLSKIKILYHDSFLSEFRVSLSISYVVSLKNKIALSILKLKNVYVHLVFLKLAHFFKQLFLVIKSKIFI